MNAPRLIDSLERFARTLPATVAGLDRADACWRPPDGAWSILEIVTHLADEEIEDFRRRLESTLTDPTAEWPGIDPEGAAVERRYNDGDLQESLARFASEREASLRWLRSLEDPDWSVAHEHAVLGSLRAGDLLLSWATHDLLHLRQIGKRLYQLACRDGETYGAEYAGRAPE